MNKILKTLTVVIGFTCVTNYAFGMIYISKPFNKFEGLSKAERRAELKDKWLYNLEYFLELKEEKFNREPESASEIIKDHVQYIRSQIWSKGSWPTVAELLYDRLTYALIYIDKFELFIPEVREQIKKLILQLQESV
jgi:hypothetical protein